MCFDMCMSYLHERAVCESIGYLPVQLQHTEIQCNALQRTGTHRQTLEHTATHCNSIQSTGYVPEIVNCFSKKVWTFLYFAGTKSPLLSGTDYFIPLFAK